MTQQSTHESTPQEELPSYPFSFAEHSLECPVEYERLRAQCPVSHVKMPYGGNAVLLTRHADVAKAFTDPACGIIQAADGDVPRVEAGMVIGSGDGDSTLFSASDARHNQIRRLVTQAFTVKFANELAPGVVDVTNKLIDAMERSGPPADLFENYAIQTPMAVICDMLGVPAKDEQQFRQWAKTIISTTIAPEELQAQRMQMVQYMLPLIEQERQQPRNTILSMLVKASERGDEVLSVPEVLSFAIGLVVAGFETVSTTFTNSAFILLQRPDLLEQLKERLDDPPRLASAIEEILRVTPIGLSRPGLRGLRGERLIFLVCRSRKEKCCCSISLPRTGMSQYFRMRTR
ncbi:hypothetical protein KDW_41980 [Dictyobacter vulcani]|uniref:Cytochrome P450 n=1 Tax=Dictyobacter vulcani TaxID=2607529 RepID=A0A5J4KY21_9CHLR|nr:cytochrome P450 [Dictyobacter vulcani]GER90036.1 hypothetical protein KDW_41980 [Dictyobacter vulcani]